MKLTAEQINALKHNLNWTRHFTPYPLASTPELRVHLATLISALEAVLSNEVQDNAAIQNTKSLHEYLDAVVPKIEPGHICNRVRILIDRFTETQTRLAEAVHQNTQIRAQCIEYKNKCTGYEVGDTVNRLEINLITSEHERHKLLQRVLELEQQQQQQSDMVPLVGSSIQVHKVQLATLTDAGFTVFKVHNLGDHSVILWQQLIDGRYNRVSFPNTLAVSPPQLIQRIYGRCQRPLRPRSPLSFQEES